MSCGVAVPIYLHIKMYLMGHYTDFLKNRLQCWSPSLERLMQKLKLQYFGHTMQRSDSLEKTLMLGKIEGRRKEDDRGDGWRASPTQWTWVWASSRSWWWTGRPGMLQSMGSQRVRHDWATELNWRRAEVGSLDWVTALIVYCWKRSEPIAETLGWARDRICCVMICTLILLNNWLDTYLMVFPSLSLLQWSTL